MDDGFKNVAKVNSPPSEGEAATRGERTLSSSPRRQETWRPEN